MRAQTLLQYSTRQSEMADLARRATRWVGTFPYILTSIPNLYDHSFPRYGQITFLTFRRPTTLTFDLKFWKYLSVTVYPYVICMPSFIMIGWEMAEILHFEILRKHGQTNKHTHKQTNTQTNKQTNKQTNRHGHYNTSPSPYGGRGNESLQTFVHTPGRSMYSVWKCNVTSCLVSRQRA